MRRIPCPALVLVLLAGCASDPAQGGRDSLHNLDGMGPGLDGVKVKTDHQVVTDGGPVPDGGPPPVDGPPPSHPEVYGVSVHSPITPFVTAQLKKITQKASRVSNVFSKIGDSITVSNMFLSCFAGSKVDLGAQGNLAGTRAFFKSDLGGGVTPYTRKSLCATVGWPASKAIQGTPSPLEQEVSAVSPRFAVVMYGTNDIGWKNIAGYANNMLDITDMLIARGVIPLLTTIPPRDDKASADIEVPRYNAVIRAVAQARQVPMLDYHQELLPLSNHGLGGDGVHPTVFGGGCVFSGQGLSYGYNVRNLLTLQALHRVKQVVVDGKAAPDNAGPPRKGTGAAGSPIEITAFPFVDRRNTKGWPQSKIPSYSGCSASQDESGPEFLYRLKLSKTTSVRAMVFDRGQVDIDVHLLDSSASGAGCIKRSDQLITATLQPGTYFFSLDTFVKSGQPLSGEYLFVLLKE